MGTIGYNFLLLKNKIAFYFCTNQLQLRNSDRKNTRDKVIVEAFYKLYDVNRLRIDDVLAELANEIFFLDPDTVYAIVFYNKGNKEYYGQLVDGAVKVPKRKLLKAL